MRALGHCWLVEVQVLEKKGGAGCGYGLRGGNAEDMWFFWIAASDQYGDIDPRV